MKEEESNIELDTVDLDDSVVAEEHAHDKVLKLKEKLMQKAKQKLMDLVKESH